MPFSFEPAGPAELSQAGTTRLHGVFNPVTDNRQWVVPMRIIARSILFATGLLFAAVTANAQAYYSGYYYPGHYYPDYTTYPGTVVAPSPTYTYPYYDNYVYPRYAWAPYYSKPTAYNDPYVALRPYSDGAGPKAN